MANSHSKLVDTVCRRKIAIQLLLVEQPTAQPTAQPATSNYFYNEHAPHFLIVILSNKDELESVEDVQKGHRFKTTDSPIPRTPHSTLTERRSPCCLVLRKPKSSPIVMPERASASRKSARVASGAGPQAGAGQSTSPSPAADGSRVWLPELVERYARFLPPNEVALTLRLVCRATASQFRGGQHTIIRLSQPCPPAEFAAHWGDVRLLRLLPRERRRQLLQLTAAAGVLDNLRLLLDRHGAEHCRGGPDVLQAAAEAGQVGKRSAWHAAPVNLHWLPTGHPRS